MQRPQTKTIIISGVVIAALFLLTNDHVSQWLIVLLFAGGIPATNLYVPPWIMLIFWAFCGLMLLGWLGWHAASAPRPRAAKPATAYYHKTRRKQPQTVAQVRRRTVRRSRSTR